jgi:folate-binding protein YgfZ
MADFSRDDLTAGHAALTFRAGLVELHDRTKVEVIGDDRATFLHNMCTADVRSLTPGRGCEAFFCSAQGKILGYTFVFCTPQSFVLDTSPGQDRLISHLDRFIIREKVELHDRTAEWGEFLLAGPKAESVLLRLGATVPEAAPLAHVATHVDERDVWLRRVELTGPSGFLVACNREDADVVGRALTAGGAEIVGYEAFDAARIEAGTPFYGRDITDENLPQEAGRDALAISFKKGCYLGQETVARIDALGHVNRHLARVRFFGQEIPASGEELSSGDKVVGQVTSAAWSPRASSPIALAYIRRGFETPGTRLTSRLGDVEVASRSFAAG